MADGYYACDWEGGAPAPPQPPTAQADGYYSCSWEGADGLPADARPATQESYNVARNFNDEYQACVAALTDETMDEEDLEVLQRLSQVGRDFAFAARTYGKIIIHEKFLREADKVRALWPRTQAPACNPSV